MSITDTNKNNHTKTHMAAFIAWVYELHARTLNVVISIQSAILMEPTCDVSHTGEDA